VGLEQVLLSKRTAVFRRYLRAATWPVAVPFGLVFVLVIRVVSPWVKVRFGSIESSRVGHLSAHVEIARAQLEVEAQTDPRRLVLVACFRNLLIHGLPANRFLTKIWRREMIVLPAWLLGPAITLNRRLFSSQPQYEIFRGDDRDLTLSLEATTSSVQLRDSEEKSGWAQLERLGVPAGSKIVCLAARDSAYLKSRYPENDFSYHDFRDSDIDTFSLAANWLVDQGFYVIRMGKVVEKQWSTGNPRVIDYANSVYRSDFMDVFISSKCSFMISTQLGIDSIAHSVFRKPMLYVNVVPIGVCATNRSKVLLSFKHHVDVDSGEELDLDVLGQRNVLVGSRKETFERAGVKVLGNSPEHILEATKEMLARVEKDDWCLTDDQRLRHDSFVQDLRNSMGDRYGEFHSDFRAIVCRATLKA